MFVFSAFFLNLVFFMAKKVKNCKSKRSTHNKKITLIRFYLGMSKKNTTFAFAFLK